MRSTRVHATPRANAIDGRFIFLSQTLRAPHIYTVTCLLFDTHSHSHSSAQINTFIYLGIFLSSHAPPPGSISHPGPGKHHTTNSPYTLLTLNTWRACCQHLSTTPRTYADPLHAARRVVYEPLVKTEQRASASAQSGSRSVKRGAPHHAHAGRICV